eukprot:TRINITY_DN28786_c0_g1_i1.p1 TRINITY_DN28786_c0_g1~~TRINITY_DN28786_c0_g1_i1.p1  ORF type:complete len:1195 (-),score=241.76 TRINITY_DN28786_c0_g1_i1:65-3565(-)
MEFSKVQSDGYASVDSAGSNDGGVCCCMAWRLSKPSQATISKHQLRALHVEIQSVRELVGATVIEVAATHGALQCKDSRHLAVSAEDTALRLGQLLLRWCSEQEPRLELAVGMHTGGLDVCHLPRGHKLYFGPALSGAVELADDASSSMCIKLRENTKAGLKLYEQLPYTLTGSDMYRFDPFVEGSQLHSCPQDVRWPSKRSSGRRKEEEMNNKVLDPGYLGVHEFGSWLERYGIDTSLFGRGEVQTLSQLHHEIMEEKKAVLVEVNGFLERRLEVVFVSIVAKSKEGHELVLRSAVDVTTDRRSLGIVVTVPFGSHWTDALRDRLASRFGLSREVQEELLPIEANWFKEEKKLTRSLPVMQTTYRTHKVRMRITKTSRKELQCISLPNMSTFAAHDLSHWAWVSWEAGAESSNQEVLTKLLQDNKINLSEWPHGSFSQLLTEVYDTQAATLQVVKHELIRHVRVIKVWLVTDILSVSHLLVTKSKDRPLSMCVEKGISWEQALENLLSLRLGLKEDFMKKSVMVDQSSYHLFEEIEYSLSYPGLKTVYRIHEVTCRVADPHAQLGLPDGNDFTVCRSGITTRYTWQPFKAHHSLIGRRTSFKKTLLGGKDLAELSLPSPKRQLPLPEPMVFAPGGDANCRLKDLMRGKETDWVRARHAAMHICDCVASFPELALFTATENEMTSSGRSAADEYQRTLGALFAVYWLMRLHGDGLQSFVYGVGEDWKPLSAASVEPVRSAEDLKKRQAFYSKVDMGQIGKILVSAGLFQGGFCNGANDPERTLALLVLSAIHDIMKVTSLLPVVTEASGPFEKHKVGDVIYNHDTALGYILQYMPDVLPSYAGLPEEQKESVKFTQFDMEFNLGWLVQAEAPPGILFSRFKRIIRQGKAKSSDVALYLVHWLTDLAGAEPYPEEGAEKFVLKFPPQLFVSFLSSFHCVTFLSQKSETAVMEDYLCWRWAMNEPPLGPIPRGDGAIALMRLVVMAQGHCNAVLDAWKGLNAEDKEVLANELTRTARAEQFFELALKVEEGGPAFLVYYAPALMQKNCGLDPEGALIVLAEILRHARAIWPLQESAADDTVIIQIDVLKGFHIAELLDQPRPGECWVLKRQQNEINATVCKEPVPKEITPDRRPLCFEKARRNTHQRRTSCSSDAMVREQQSIEDDVG